MTPDIKQLVKKQLKDSYSNSKLGSVTYSDFNDDYHYDFINLFKEKVSSIVDEEVTSDFYEDCMNSFIFTKKVYFKVGPACEYRCDSFRVLFQPHGKSIELYKIEVYKQGKGIGSSLLKLMNEISNEVGTTVYLRPVEYMNTSIEQLRTWYSRNGFKRCEKSVYWSNK